MRGFKIQLLLFLILMIYGCHKDHQIPKPTGSQLVDVYVYGGLWHLDASGLYPKNGDAVYYKNGGLVTLNLPANSTSPSGIAYVHSIAISGDTIYAGGSYTDELLSPFNTVQALYWINGTVHVLAVPDVPVPIILSTEANGKNYYELYFGENSSGTAIANGVAINGVIKNQYNSMNGMIVSGTDVYVFGSSASDKSAIYYKNNQPVQFVAQTNAMASSITGMCISGQDVYACGNLSFGSAVAGYWKNGQLIILNPTTVNARATGIVVNGKDVYVAGYIETRNTIPGKGNSPVHAAVLWKNGVMTTLSSPTDDSYTTNIAAAGNDIYVGGYSGPDSAFTVYWKNGTPVKFKIAPKDSLLVNGVIVAPEK